MSKIVGKNQFRILTASVCIALAGSFAFAKPKTELVKEEAGFYYGYGKASTKDQAEFAAKKDLIETSLTTTLRASNPKAARISISDEAAKARLNSIKPFQQDKPGTNVTYRIKVADWEKEEKTFSEKLRTSLAPRYEALASKKFAEKMNEAVAILNVLAENGENELLTVQAAGTELFSRKVEALCASALKDLVLSVSVKDGFIANDTKFTVNASDKNGKAVSGLNVKVCWEVASILPSDKEIAEVVAVVKTDSLGNASVDYPVSEDFRNKAVTLTVSTAFATSSQASAAMKKLDADSSVDGRFVHFDDLSTAFAAASVEAGEFDAGAVAQDTRAGGKEASHKATTVAYAISLTPVTNAEYAAFLHATRADVMPEYFENDAYNQEKQPVVGVSYADAEAYAEWLSEQTGNKYRLPTEEEWEKAARAGTSGIYPWGDEAPNKGKNANYKGNGKFNGPSPVGSFEKGNNAWGLVDMAGNVWEWTSSTHNVDAESSLRTVKGGSWMDGPVELRISNYRNSDGQSGYPDVGFRVVKEVSE